jgi:DNA-binding GntR family transcriptional regulator
MATSKVKPVAEVADRSAAETSLVETVYDQILMQIINAQLPGGAPLKTTQLATQLAVSRTPVIQALQRLAADGIVTLEMNKRAVVRAGAEKWLIELHELRELLEPTAAARAALRLPREGLARLDQSALAARPHIQPAWQTAARQFDFDLHLAIADHCDNFALRQTLHKIWRFKRISYLAAPESSSTLEKAYAEHLAVLSALHAHDAETARAAMHFHLRSAASLRGSNVV